MGKGILRRQKMFPHPGKGNLHSQAVFPSRPRLPNPSHLGHRGALCQQSSSQLVQLRRCHVLHTLLCVPAAVPGWEGSRGLPRAFPPRRIPRRVVFQPEPGHATAGNQAWHRGDSECSAHGQPCLASLGVWACRAANTGSTACLPRQPQQGWKILILHGLGASRGTPGRSGALWRSFAGAEAGQIME